MLSSPSRLLVSPRAVSSSDQCIMYIWGICENLLELKHFTAEGWLTCDARVIHPCVIKCLNSILIFYLVMSHHFRPQVSKNERAPWGGWWWGIPIGLPTALHFTCPHSAPFEVSRSHSIYGSDCTPFCLSWSRSPSHSISGIPIALHLRKLRKSENMLRLIPSVYCICENVGAPVFWPMGEHGLYRLLGNNVSRTGHWSENDPKRKSRFSQ